MNAHFVQCGFQMVVLADEILESCRPPHLVQVATAS